MTQISKNIIFNFLSGSATPIQKQLIERWLQEDVNKEIYYEWLAEWENENPQIVANTEQDLSLFLQKIADDDNPPISPLQKENTFRPGSYYYARAAIVALIFSSIAAFYWFNFLQYKKYSTAYGEIQKILLEDSTEVVLNANSTLKLKRFGFGEQVRDVFLEGEAEFHVKHTIDDKKFVVHTSENLDVEVLGTKFLVYSRARGSKVVLNEGSVALHLPASVNIKKMLIEPGDVVTLEEGELKLKRNQPVQKHVAWKYRQFVFDQTSFQDIVFSVEESFGMEIEVKDSTLLNRKISGTYEAENAQELLNALGKILGSDIKIQDNKASIY